MWWRSRRWHHHQRLFHSWWGSPCSSLLSFSMSSAICPIKQQDCFQSFFRNFPQNLLKLYILLVLNNAIFIHTLWNIESLINSHFTRIEGNFFAAPALDACDKSHVWIILHTYTEGSTTLDWLHQSMYCIIRAHPPISPGSPFLLACCEILPSKTLRYRV